MNKMIGIVLMVVGFVSLIVGLIVYFSGKENTSGDDIKVIQHAVDMAVSDGVLTSNEKDTLRRLAIEKQIDAEFVIDTAHRRIAESKVNAETTIIDKNKKNGVDFEKFIVQKFNPKYFKIKQWAGDKYVNGKYAETTLNPDLILEFSLGKEKHTFAVECKWRKDLYNGGLQIADEGQLDRYRKYEHKSGSPVFMAIGFGNEGASPSRLFIVPLSQVNDNFLRIDYLAAFEKQEIGKNFYYDYKKRELE